MSDSIQVDEEALIEINITVHVLSIVLVQQFNVSVQIALIEYAVNAFGWSHQANFVSNYAVTVTDTLISHGLVLDDLYVVFSVNLIFKRAKSL